MLDIEAWFEKNKRVTLLKTLVPDFGFEVPRGIPPPEKKMRGSIRGGVTLKTPFYRDFSLLSSLKSFG